ncbi:hypothetical protein [Nitratifractor salsuginis]|uniref:Uncharacterized protein n=1 Tax=Nitratifractor salsuginis (strain DSM 16511 / JCM 12458 / E9I37-1) TaxID=749222 RepID=E6X1S6_NITSE|nr:hypothetical protein [Nitratifractor salsuginis]ADV47067.1 hypothetical protein Nitsa_1822 [Nitratifractor salsuginis DSM 16511]
MKQKIEEAKVLLARAQARLAMAQREDDPAAIKHHVLKAQEILGSGKESEWRLNE